MGGNRRAQKKKGKSSGQTPTPPPLPREVTQWGGMAHGLSKGQGRRMGMKYPYGLMGAAHLLLGQKMTFGPWGSADAP